MTNEEKVKTITEMFAALDSELEIEIKFEEEAEKVFVGFPREDDDLEYDFDELLQYHSLVLTETDTERVCTTHTTQFPILGHDYYASELVTEKKRLEYSNSGIEIKIVKNPILIGICAVTLGEYSKYCPPCSPYLALQISYAKPELRPGLTEELNMAKAFMFQQSYLADVAIPFSAINDIYDAWDDDEDEDSLNELIEITELSEFTAGMELFGRALESTDPEIRFLFYYKLIEFYAPIVAKRIAYEKLTQKLDAIRLKGANSKDIEAILSIASQNRSSQTDKELAQSVLKATVDTVDVYPKLPEDIRKKIRKEVGFDPAILSHETSSEIKEKIALTLGKVLYSTRNNIVHAKSNHTPDSNECRFEDLPELNICLKDVTYNIINWFNRLPEHIR
jgi:hypothetical protein